MQAGLNQSHNIIPQLTTVISTYFTYNMEAHKTLDQETNCYVNIKTQNFIYFT